MAGWFEAFANFAKAGEGALDRYAQMRQLREDKRVEAEQRAFENKLRMAQSQRQEELARLQSEQLSNAILGQRQDTFTKYRLPGSEISEPDMATARQLGLGGNILTNRPSPLIQATLKMQPEGQAYMLGENPEDAPMPLAGGLDEQTQNVVGLPDDPYTGNRWLGTPEQQLQERQYRMQMGALQNARIDDPNSLMQFDLVNGNQPDVRRYLPPQRNQPQGTVNPFTEGLRAWQAANPGKQPTMQDIQEIARLDDQPRAAGSSAATAPSVVDGLDDELRNAVGRITMSLNGPRRAGFTQTINDYVSRGVPREQIVDVIRQAALESEGAVQRDKLMARQEMRAQLANAREALKGLKAAGLPTDWLTGGVENTLRRLGTTNDPKYVTFKQQLEDAVINYRRAASGAAFTESERQSYERMFPSYSNSGEVNEALIGGLLASSDAIERNYWNHKLGPGGYDFISGTAADQANLTRQQVAPPSVIPDGAVLVRDPATGKLRVQ